MSILSSENENLAQKIAGEIIFSKKPGTTLKKWREVFSITQTEAAKKTRQDLPRNCRLLHPKRGNHQQQLGRVQ